MTNAVVASFTTSATTYLLESFNFGKYPSVKISEFTLYCTIQYKLYHCIMIQSSNIPIHLNCVSLHPDKIRIRRVFDKKHNGCGTHQWMNEAIVVADLPLC